MRVVHIMCRVNAHMCVPKKHRVCVREQPTACIHTVYRFAQSIQTRSVLVHWPAPVSSSGARTPMRLSTDIAMQCRREVGLRVDHQHAGVRVTAIRVSPPGRASLRTYQHGATYSAKNMNEARLTHDVPVRGQPSFKQYDRATTVKYTAPLAAGWRRVAAVRHVTLMLSCMLYVHCTTRY